MNISVFFVFTVILKFVTGCFQVHLSMVNMPLEGDFVTAQIKRNGEEVCIGSQRKTFASAKTVFTINCKSGHTIKVWDNARSAEIDDGKGYKSMLYLSDSHSSDYDCGRFKCSEVESCLDDNFWDCDLYEYCALCDFRTYC
ncbi:unnamed protein product [Cunninghamella echinulata]